MNSILKSPPPKYVLLSRGPWRIKTAVRKIDYDIPGLRIIKSDLNDEDPDYRYVTYSCFLCKITVASDFLGTQICHDGVFFDNMLSFPHLEDGVEYLKLHKDRAIKFFRKEHIKSMFKFPIWKMRYKLHRFFRSILALKNYFAGNIQGGVPDWAMKISPKYTNNDNWKIGPFILHLENGRGGDTFFMALKRNLK